MEAPPQACRLLAEHFPKHRVAWMGRQSEDCLNPGHFVLVELIPWYKVGSPEDPLIFQDLWFFDSFGARITRGPIFSKKGKPRPDWNLSAECPVIVAHFNGSQEYEDGTPLSVKDLFTGHFIQALRYWASPIKERRDKAAKETQSARRSANSDKAESYAEWSKRKILSEGLRSGHKAWKHIKEDTNWDKYELDLQKSEEGL